MPDKIFILAAGKGARMQPLTKTIPKPMVEVNGQPVIDHILDQCIASNVTHIGMNLHYFGNKLESHLNRRDDIKVAYSKEPTLLDTGGGIRKGARLMGDGAFFITSGDSYWIDGSEQSALKRLSDFWDEKKMDIAIMLQPINSMAVTNGIGDYHINESGQAIRSKNQMGTHMFTSLRIMKPEILRGTPEGPFSFLDILDKAEHENRLYGLEHDGEWHHISTPEDVEKLTQHLSQE